jgi:hypothetical protein
LNSITNSALYYKETQPNAIEAAKIPQMIVYPYKRWTYNPGNTGGTINSNSTAVVSTTNITFGRVPHKIYLAVRKIRTSQNWADSESFLPISNVNVNFGAGTSGILSRASQRQLWLMTCENLGWDCSPTWEEFSGRINVSGVNGSGSATVVPSIGSPVVFRPAYNFNLDQALTEGSVGQFQFSVIVTLNNYTSSAVNYEMVILYEDQGVAVAQNGQFQTVLGINDVSLVLRTKESQESTSQSDVEEQICSGKSFHAMMKHKHHKKHGGSLSGGSDSGGMMRSKLDRLSC